MARGLIARCALLARYGSENRDDWTLADRRMRGDAGRRDDDNDDVHASERVVELTGCRPDKHARGDVRRRRRRTAGTRRRHLCMNKHVRRPASIHAKYIYTHTTTYSDNNNRCSLSAIRDGSCVLCIVYVYMRPEYANSDVWFLKPGGLSSEKCRSIQHYTRNSTLTYDIFK